MLNKKKYGYRRIPKEARLETNCIHANSSCSNQSSPRKQYTPVQMTSALNAVLENGISANKAAATSINFKR